MKVSIIICSYYEEREKRLQDLVNDIKKQIQSDYEIIIIKSISPVGKARNMGIKKAKGDIIIFFDDDVRLGKNTIKNLIDGLKKYKKAIVGGSHIIPINSNFIQRLIAREIPREEVKIVHNDQESDLVGTACWASYKTLYDEIGYFNETIIAGEDTKLREKAKKNGYKIILLANTYVFHPTRDNLIKFFQQRYWYGRGIGESRKNYYPYIIKVVFSIFYFILRILFFPIHIFLPNFNNYIKNNQKLMLNFKPFYAFSDLFFVLGQIRGFNEK